MLPNLKTYTCAVCGTSEKFTGYRQARAAGWSVSKDYTIFHCPTCAPLHRRGKATEKNDEPPQFLPPGWEQIKIENLG